MTEQKVKDILAKQLGVDKAKITENTNIATDLGADSLDLVEILMSLEEEFSVSIPESNTKPVFSYCMDLMVNVPVFSKADSEPILSKMILPVSQFPIKTLCKFDMDKNISLKFVERLSWFSRILGGFKIHRA